MKQRHSAGRGITLIELMVTILAFGVLATSVVFTMVNFYSMNKDANDLSGRLVELDLAFRLFAEYGMVAEDIELTGSNNVRLIRDDSAGLYYDLFYQFDVPSGVGYVMWQPSDAPSAMAVADDVTGLTFTQTGNLLEMDVSFNLYGGKTFNRKMTIFIRNVLE